MRFRYLVVALTLLAPFASDSWGQSKRHPAKGQQEQTQSQEQKTAPNQRGTDQLPLIVQPLPTKKTADIAEREKRDAEEKANSDLWTWLLTLLTVVALFGQLAVFIAQAYFLKGTLIATADAAKAAVIAAQHIPRVERAYLFVGPYDPCEMWNEDATQRITTCGLTFENQGKTPAILKRAYGQFSDWMPTSDVPHYDLEGGKLRMLDMAIPGGGEPIKERSLFESKLTGPQYFSGYVEYDDIFREEVRVSRFCIKIDPHTDVVELAGPRSWNDWT
jgi:hypothetical protein